MIKLVMLVRNNYPQVLKAATTDEKAMEYLEDIATEYAPKWWETVTEEEAKDMIERLNFETESDDDGSAVIVVETVILDK